MKSNLLLFFYFIFISEVFYGQIMTKENTFFGCEPTSFTFYTLGNTHSGQIWNSDNGSTSNLDTATFTYSTAGTYNVTIGSLRQTITVYPKLVYNFTTDSPTTGCFPFKFNLRDVTFYPPGITPISLEWVYQNGGGKIGNPITDVINQFPQVNENIFIKLNVKTNSPSCDDTASNYSFFKILDKPIAKIQTDANSSCKVPFVFNLNNLSSDLLHTDLNFLWKWNKPTAGSTTDSIPPPIIYNTNLTDIVTLEVTNKYGCKSKDSIRVSIDTPVFNFTVPYAICINDIREESPNYGNIVIQNAEVNNFTYTINSSAYIIVAPLNDTTYRFTANVLPSGFYPISITKSSITDPTCKTTITKNVYLINDMPDGLLYKSSPCKAPLSDTIRVRRVTSNVDSIFYNIAYIDRYGIIVKDSFFGDGMSENIHKYKTDSTLIYNIKSYKDADSFYRKGPLTINIYVSFYNKQYKCKLTDTVFGVNTSIFSASLIDYKKSGCAPLKDSFRVLSYGTHKIDSVYWFFGDNTSTATFKDTTRTHLYSTAGVYKAFAIVKNNLGCVDTTNPIFIKRADSIIPQLSISKTNFCNSDSTTFTINNPNKFDKWQFVTDSFKSYNCPNETTYTWPHFYNVGWQHVYLIAEKYGCVTKYKDSVFVNGPNFFLDYDFKCSRRDLINFIIRDTQMISPAFYSWEIKNLATNAIFTRSGSQDTIWHRFSGDSVNYQIKVTANNASGCSFSDSTVVKIRNVKAVFYDTLYCRNEFPELLLKGRPYLVNPTKSRNADYLCNYQYTWSMRSIGNPPVKFPLITYGDSAGVYFPLDTMDLTLYARDANGCMDSMTKRVIISDNHADFILDKSGYCPPSSTIFLKNLSHSPFGIASYSWGVYAIIDGNPVSYVGGSNARDTQFFINTNNLPADSFRVIMTIRDSANCAMKTVEKDFGFFRDTSNLILPQQVCQNTSGQIKSNEDNLALFKYEWYVNDVKTNDSLGSFGHLFDSVGKFKVKLVKTHRIYGCIKVFEDTTWVLVKPHIRIHNTFDTTSNKCFPAVTKISYFDSAFASGLGFYFLHAGNKTYLNPSNISLNGGVNQIKCIFYTDYGCKDTLINYDTVIKPTGEIIVDKPIICKGDSIQFTINNPTDIDTLQWVFGDGANKYGKNLSISHKYLVANTLNDTMIVNCIYYGQNKSCPVSKEIKISVLEALSSLHLNNLVDTAYCFAPIKINNTAKRADYFKYDLGDGSTDTNSSKNFIYQYNQPGKYTIRQYAYRKPLGCVDSSIRHVELFPIPSLSSKLDSICFGVDFNMTFSDTLPNTKIYIKPDFYSKNPYLNSPIKTRITKLSDSIVTLISISNNNCSDTLKQKMYILYPDSLNKLDTIIAMGNNVKIPVKYNPAYRYIWSPSLNNPSCNNCDNPIVQVINPTNYKLTIVDILGCFQDTSHYFIDIFPDILVRVPTAFTPNGDGNNDIMYARGFGIKKLISFKIFNRLGQLLFLTNDENYGWDGTYKGVPQNSDAYFYTYEAESFIPNKFVSGEGNFMLLR